MGTETISLTDLRPRLSELIERAHEQFDRFVITRHGRAEAILLSSEEFSGLLESLEMLSTPDQLQRLSEASAELSAGGGSSLDDVRQALADASG